MKKILWNALEAAVLFGTLTAVFLVLDLINAIGGLA